VVRAEAGVITINPLPGKVWNAECETPTIHNLLPGTQISVTVDAHISNGLKVALKGGLIGYIHHEQLGEVTQDVDEYSVGSSLDARLLFIQPTTNTIFLTLRDVRSKDVFKGLKAGQLVEGAQVERSTNHSVILKLGNDQYGLVNVRKLSEGKEVVKNVKKKFPPGKATNARVLALDYSSGLAVCTIQKSQLSGVQSLDQLTIGQKITATVMAFKTKGLLVNIGPHLNGFIPHLFLSDVALSKPELKYLPGDKITCKVLRLDPENKKVILTSKPILVNNDFSIVSCWDEALPETITEGVVFQIKSEGLLLQLWGQMRGWVPKSMLSVETIDCPEKLFFVGQALKCKVVDANESKDRVTLSLVLDSMKPLGRKEKGGQMLELGREYRCKVTRITPKGADVSVTHEGVNCRAIIPTMHLTDHPSLAGQILATLSVGDEVTGRVWHKDVVTLITMKPSLLRDWDNLPKSINEYEVGTLVPGVVQMVKNFGVFLRVPGLAKLVLAPTRLLQDYYLDSPEDVYDQGQTIYCRVMEVDREAEKVCVSTRVKDVADKDETGAKVLQDWLEVFNDLPSTWLNRGLVLGEFVSGPVTEVTEFGVIMDIGGARGIVTNTNLGLLAQYQAVAVGDMLQGVVLYVDKAAGCVELGCDSKLVARAASRKKDVCDVAVGTKLRGEVLLVKTEHNLGVITVTNPKQASGLMGYLSMRKHLNDLAGQDLETGKEVTVIVSAVTENGDLVLVTGAEARKAVKRTRGESESDGGVKRARKDSKNESVDAQEKKNKSVGGGEDVSIPASIATPTNFTDEEVKIKKKVKGAKENKLTLVSSKIASEEEDKSNEVELNTSSEKKVKSKKKEKSKTLEKESKTLTLDNPVKFPEETIVVDPGWDYSATSVTRPAWQKASIWSDDEEDSEQDEERSHMSKAEAKKRKRVEEEEAAKREQRVLDGELEKPDTEDEFERLVVSSPDSSLVWVQYMALCVQMGELDKARAVARRALARINFRAEDERLNVFLAWLNLENTFGNEEAMGEVMREALQCCDQYKVYSQVAAIYSQSAKINEAEKTFKILVKKFSREKEVWIKFAIFYFKSNKLNDGRFLLQRSKQSLDKRDHVDIATKFAQIEFRYGDPERGKTLFETILSNFPRRTDLWSVYVDQLVKTGDIEAARTLYRRISTLNLQAKKMKFLFKKWLDFETVHGSESGVSEVKQAAHTYLDARATTADIEEK